MFNITIFLEEQARLRRAMQERLHAALQRGETVFETFGVRTVAWPDCSPFKPEAVNASYLAEHLTSRHFGFGTTLGFDNTAYIRGRARNVRVRVHHAGTVSQMTLRWGKRLTTVSGGWTDEGYSITERAYWLEIDNAGRPVVMRESYTHGRDCDGPHEHYAVYQADAPLPGDVEVRHWREVRGESWQRDYYAEAMGY